MYLKLVKKLYFCNRKISGQKKVVVRIKITKKF